MRDLTKVIDQMLEVIPEDQETLIDDLRDR